MTTCDVGSANSCCKHRIPPLEWLLPKRKRPGELPVFDHVLVAAPDVIHKYIEAAMFNSDAVKRRFNLLIVCVVTANRYTSFTEISFLDGPAGDVYCGA